MKTTRRDFLSMSLSYAPLFGVLVNHSCDREDCVICSAKSHPDENQDDAQHMSVGSTREFPCDRGSQPSQSGSAMRSGDV